MSITENYPYYHPITVRFADLDPQGHVNNSVYLTYLESARLGFYEQVGIWHPNRTMQTGMVVAHTSIDFIAPILFGQSVRVGLRLEKIGTKSFTFTFLIETTPDQIALARGTCVIVAFDPEINKSIPLPDKWRKKLENFSK
jgi:acyl-CoA thioester hydrolase